MSGAAAELLEIDVIDADDLVAMHVDDLLVEDIALEQKVGLVGGQKRRVGRGAELHLTRIINLKLCDGNEGERIAAPGRGSLQDDAVDMRGIDRGGDRDFMHLAERDSLRVDHDAPHEGGDTCPLIGMLGHKGIYAATRLYILAL